MKKKMEIFVVLLSVFITFNVFFSGTLFAYTDSYPYLSLSGTMNFATNNVSINGSCDSGAIIFINGKLFDSHGSKTFSTELNIKNNNYFVVATPNGKSVYVTLEFPQMPSSLIKALPKVSFSFNTKDMILNYGGTMQHKPAGKVTGYVYNSGNDKSASFVVGRDNSFESKVPLSSGNNIIHSYARYLYFFKFSVPDFSVDFESAKVLKLKINSPYMYINGSKREVDPGRGTTPVILKGWDRTLLPVRAVAEGLGGKVGWDGKERKVTIRLGDSSVKLWIDNPVAEVNGKKVYIDSTNHKVKPIIINDRTMLPVRFVAESLGAYVKWYASTREVLVVYPTK
jgi:hypothetical protein